MRVDFRGRKLWHTRLFDLRESEQRTLQAVDRFVARSAIANVMTELHAATDRNPGANRVGRQTNDFNFESCAHSRKPSAVGSTFVFCF